MSSSQTLPVISGSFAHGKSCSCGCVRLVREGGRFHLAGGHNIATRKSGCLQVVCILSLFAIKYNENHLF